MVQRHRLNAMHMSATAELYGLVLAGGRSRRMQRDKAALVYAGPPAAGARDGSARAAGGPQLHLAARQDQQSDPLRSGYETIVDRLPDLGPIGGIHAALHTAPDKAWLILACDLPFLDRATLERLIAERDPSRLATAYRSSLDGLPEPLCAIYEPSSRAAHRALDRARRALPAQIPRPARGAPARSDERRARSTTSTRPRNTPPRSHSPATARAAPIDVTAPPRHSVCSVRYFALLREQAGRSAEELETSAATALELYQELRRRRGLALDPERLRVAVNDEFGDWDTRLSEGDTVAFLPPVAGG